MLAATMFVFGFLFGVSTTFVLIAMDKNVVITRDGLKRENEQQSRKRGTTGEARSIYGNPNPPGELWDDEMA